MRAAAPIDDRAGADDLGAGPLGNRHRLARRSGGGDDVLDDEDLVVGDSVKPRRNVSVPSCRSAKSARTSSARATSWPITMPPRAGERHGRAPRRGRARASAAPMAFGVARVLQDERTLQITGAVKARRQPKMALEQGAGPAKQRQDVGFVHRAVV